MNNSSGFFNAHYNAHSNKYQSLFKHSSQTAEIALQKSPKNQLKHTITMLCMFHDIGKYNVRWQEYFEEAIRNTDNKSGRKEDHTTAGGIILDELLADAFIKRLMQTAIYSHHGLQDCIAVDSASLFRKRLEKSYTLPTDECKCNFYNDFGVDMIQQLSRLVMQESECLKKSIQATVKMWGSNRRYGNRDFFLGMYTRLLSSLLMDADKRDTADFMNGEATETVLTEDELQKVWSSCITNVENKIAGFTEDSLINKYRSYVSDLCWRKAAHSSRLYRLTLPTGAGKTLSSLRFAVHHAYEYKKKRIIYVAPFHSIVEQNAKEIRKAIGMPEYVLEHHCNLVLETEEEQELYDRLTEDWSVPIVVTTAVQFLNTLFTSKKSNIRRFQSLSDSVIIIDEVQALPILSTELFNMTANFLTEFLNTTMILCTATQPLLDKLPEHALYPPEEMVQERSDFREVTKRTEIVDCTVTYPGGMSIDTAVDFVIEKVELYEKLLFVVNTKTCARNLYQKLKSSYGEQALILHLSTNMCPEHRSDILKKIKTCLKTDGNLICITTQLIEAGVDISFPCVIRSLAGLDNLIQAAGRCNRNKEWDLGYVYLVNLDKTAESLTYLPEIVLAQEAMRKVLDQFRSKPEVLGESLDSAEAIHMYYDQYFWSRKTKLCYPVNIDGVTTSIVDLLSGNPEFTPDRYAKQLLKQAFKTAGDYYEAIPDRGDLSVIVPYDEKAEEMVQKLVHPYCRFSEMKRLLRKLQSYTVSVSQSNRKKLESGIWGILNNQVLILDERYYSHEFGVTTEPEPMKTLML